MSDATTREPSPRSRSRVPGVLLPVIGVAVTIAAFELAPRVGILPRDSFPPVSEMAAAVVDLTTDGDLLPAIGDTVSAWAWALAIAVVIGIPLGALLGSSRLALLLGRSPIEFLRPIPSVALIPVLILIYGSKPALTIALGAFGATFPLLYQAMYGIADVDPVARDTARAFRLGRVARLRAVVLPSMTPYLATGLRLSASVALILVVTGEYVVGVDGLGREVFATQSGGAYDRMYAYILVAGVLGLVVNTAFGAAERRVLFWHPSQRREAELGA
jgi:ABC-type nitrate/sulfonate/bicarbonate transport system permease component